MNNVDFLKWSMILVMLVLPLYAQAGLVPSVFCDVEKGQHILRVIKNCGEPDLHLFTPKSFDTIRKDRLYYDRRFGNNDHPRAFMYEFVFISRELREVNIIE